MPQTLAIVTLEMQSGNPDDRVQNALAFAHASALDSVGASAIRDMVQNFFGSQGEGASASVGSWMAEAIDNRAGQSHVDFYDITGHLDGSPHGSPTFTRNFDFGDKGNDSLPNELAVCLSFHSDYGTDVEFGSTTRPRARDRGRIFVGPWSPAALDQELPSHIGKVKTQVCDDISAAAATFLQGDADWTWSVWSRSSATLKVVTEGWVDDAWDVQRRRGTAATQRSRF